MATSLLEQSIEWQKNEISKLEAAQVELDNAANAASSVYRAARNAYNDIKSNSSATADQIAQAKAEYDRQTEIYFQLRDNAAANLNRLNNIKQALNDNEIKLTQERNNPQTAVVVPPNAQLLGQNQPTSIAGGPAPTGADPNEVEQQGLATPESIIDETADEFGGLDEAIAAEENALPEPPVLSDEEAQNYLGEQDTTGDLTADRDQEDEAALEELTSGVEQARKSGVNNNPDPLVGTRPNKNWRFRISLAKGANYFYKDPGISETDILHPLKATDGVIFPYTPQISVAYNANYESVDIVHSNYKIYNYKNSSVENITITGDFTAQDTTEANYVLAVIHFFKSATKMFYGKDKDPKRGIPPPLCYLHGHGEFAFDKHPVVIQSFQLNYPNDVDYINAHVPSQNIILQPYNKPAASAPSAWSRLESLVKGGLLPGGSAPAPVFRNVSETSGSTRVPTKLTITITAIPIVTRDNISNNFSLKDYAKGYYVNKTRGVW